MGGGGDCGGLGAEACGARAAWRALTARARRAPRERERARLTGGRRLSDSNPGVSFEQLVKVKVS